MKSLYVSQQGCYLSLSQEQVLIKKGQTTLNQAQLPLIEQILIFGKSQVTTQLIHTCLKKEIPILYLSRMGYCYGRVLPIQRGYRYLSRYQQVLTPLDRLLVAQAIVTAKLKNSRVFLMRHHRSHPSTNLEMAIQQLDYLITKVSCTESTEQLLGTEGAGAAIYFSAFGDCIQNPDFIFIARSRRPPGNPINAMLSFGYQVLWNHLLSLIELNELDPYQACLHQGHERHAALTSDLLEEFRAAIVDSLVIYMINRKMIDSDQDFEFIEGGCYLNEVGRRKYLQAFLIRMEEIIGVDKQPRWDSLMRQVKKFREFVYSPSRKYQPYLIR
ncbi:CRISPR-associated endonuclease Cas1 [Thermosynechococcaceae cyanobacterium BACA0444]|uniref:CRISPR-associated endonuclease Cas1 n=1 Tax=Pseudocalidococcus azoricus BACA0444 TaxID=2918990 RepID=A0AAE4FUB4_9CYAN|nr:CRISPR-associated endonuclease Cas1 [Pseudocalidococcus azoricus BACA0444]